MFYRKGRSYLIVSPGHLTGHLVCLQLFGIPTISVVGNVVCMGQLVWYPLSFCNPIFFCLFFSLSLYLPELILARFQLPDVWLTGR